MKVEVKLHISSRDTNLDPVEDPLVVGLVLDQSVQLFGQLCRAQLLLFTLLRLVAQCELHILFETMQTETDFMLRFCLYSLNFTLSANWNKHIQFSHNHFRTQKSGKWILVPGPAAPAGRQKAGCTSHAGLRFVQTSEKYLHQLHDLKLWPGAATPDFGTSPLTRYRGDSCHSAHVAMATD